MKAQTNTTSTWLKWEVLAEENRFGVLAISLLVVGCLGGAAMQLGAVLHIWSMLSVVIPTMVTLSLLLAVVPMKWILPSILITIFIDLCIICMVQL